LQGYQNQVDLGQGGLALQLSLKLTQTSLRPVEGFGGAVSLGRDASDLFALVSLSLTALLGFVFPLIATMCSELITSAALLDYITDFDLDYVRIARWPC
jgi:hypothetical protein